MRAALEACRGCGLVTTHVSRHPRGLRFGHIRAASLGGGPEIENTTIVCGDCDFVMGSGDWTGVYLPLCDEPTWPMTEAEIGNWARHRIVIRPAAYGDEAFTGCTGGSNRPTLSIRPSTIQGADGDHISA